MTADEAQIAEREHAQAIAYHQERIAAIRASVGPPRIRVTAGAPLQNILETAPDGAIIELEAGATWHGRYAAWRAVHLTTAGEWGPGRIGLDAPVAWLRSPGNERQQYSCRGNKSPSESHPCSRTSANHHGSLVVSIHGGLR